MKETKLLFICILCITLFICTLTSCASADSGSVTDNGSFVTDNGSSVTDNGSSVTDNVGSQYTIYSVSKNTIEKNLYYSQSNNKEELVNEFFVKMGLIENNNEADLKVDNNPIKVVRYNISSKTAYVYFNQFYNNMAVSEEVLFRASIVKTLTQLEDISYVYFYVDNKALTYKNGEIVGPMAGEDFIMEYDDSIENLSFKTIKLYFAHSIEDKLVKRTIDIAFTQTVPLEKLIVSQIIVGPQKEDCRYIIDKNAELIDVRIESGVCYVNFDSSILYCKSVINPQLTIYAIVNSICDNTEADKVKFQINGNSYTKLWGISLDTLFEKNTELIKEEC